MERWAAQYKNRANFLCVGCAGARMAVGMGTESRLSNCLNAYIEHDDAMPRWGQLGCNGFIVLSCGEQKVLSAKTSAFNQVRGLAFKHVEAMLDAITTGAQVPKVCPGQMVRVSGLQSREELNGQMAVCVGPIEEESGRCTVQLLQAPQKLKIRVDNLVPQDSAPESDTDDEDIPEPRDQPCANGSCADHPGFGAAGVQPLGALEAVGVDEIDSEHQECAAALSLLAEHRSVSALQSVLEVLTAHFAHEEQLLDMWVYRQRKEPRSGFDADGNARKTHFADHSRMLRTVSSQLSLGGDKVPDSVVDRILRDFEEHAERYDRGFGKRMSLAMAEEEGV